jgi:dolichol-phosphate mannosyltransferase
MPAAAVSVIVPTYREAWNLPTLIERLEQVRTAHDLEIELVICDDDSRDGTEELIGQLDRPWVRLLVRKTDRGLSPAVLHGLRSASHNRFVVMDADLSHPPEKIPELLRALEQGADFVIGSRYTSGGTTDAEWGLFRWLNSKVATLLARPFTPSKDPMSGFFALERQTFERGVDLNPIGYKIGLEILVKCNCQQVREVPIHFADRTVGESKLSLKEQLKYIQHLRRLMIFKYPTWSYLLQFAVVGGSGTIVNLGALTLLKAARFSDPSAIAGGIFVSFLSNFFLNRRFTFSYAKHASLVPQFVGFAAASALGLVTNYGVALLFRREFSGLPIQLAAMAGIVAGMGFNYMTSRYLVFRKREAVNPGETSA